MQSVTQMKQQNQSNKNAQQYLESQERVILELGMRTAERIIGQTLQDEEESYYRLSKGR